MNYDRIKEQREKTGLSARKFAEALDIKYTADYLLGRVDDPHKLYGEEQKEKSPTPAEAEAGEIERWLTDLLVQRGYIRDGEDISDRDAAFLIHWIGLLDAWFDEE